MIDYALASATLRDMPPAESAQRIAAAGFTRLELFMAPDHLENWWLQPEHTRAVLAEHGLVVDSVHSPEIGWDNDAQPESARLASVAAAKTAIAAAAAVGAGLVVVHPNRSGPEEDVRAHSERLECTRASLRELALAADAAGVRLALENMPARTQARPGARVSELLAMIEGLGDQVGILLDVGHCNISDTDPSAEARLAGDRLWALHLQDNDGLPGHDQHLLPGCGTVDWERFLATLDALDYRGLRTFEVGAGATPPELVTQLGSLRQAWRARNGGQA